MIERLLQSFIDILYPNICIACNENLNLQEQHLCTYCLHSLPKTNFHHLKDNMMEQRLWGKSNIFRSTAFYYFHKGSILQKILHELKYNGNKELGKMLGKIAATEVIESNDFASIDLIIPVPLHPNRMKSRGYNQSEWIAKGIASILKVELNTNSLIRNVDNVSQTKKSRYDRHTNTDGIFSINDINLFERKHVLLVDDIMTTGSTLIACSELFKNIPGVRISFFTLAIAD